MIFREFTGPECERFRKECNFTDEERAIFDLRVKGKTTLEIMFALRSTPYAMSESSVERRIRRIKNKIIKVCS